MDFQECADYLSDKILADGEVIEWISSLQVDNDEKPWQASRKPNDPVEVNAIFVGKRASAFTAVVNYLKGTDTPVSSTSAFVLPKDGFTPNQRDSAIRPDGTKLIVKSVEIMKPSSVLIGYVISFDA